MTFPSESLLQFLTKGMHYLLVVFLVLVLVGQVHAWLKLRQQPIWHVCNVCITLLAMFSLLYSGGATWSVLVVFLAAASEGARSRASIKHSLSKSK